MKLAIKGHLERGKEVIKILEMMGGINELALNGTQIDSYYYIDNIDRKIHLGLSIYPYDYTIYTLEEFLEKFPYKVGDKVLYKTYGIYSKIKSMLWNEEKEHVFYRLDSNKLFVATADELKPRKEETMEEKENSIVVNIEHKQLKVHSLRFDKTQLVINDEYELKQEGDAYYIVRKKIQYPKTYEECCKIIDYYLEGTTIIGYNKYLLEIFQKLLICRDAYWKIAGEEMGLGKHWEPDWNDCAQHKFGLYTLENEISYINLQVLKNIILVFPTEEIRDIFYETFKELIENCKELL